MIVAVYPASYQAVAVDSPLRGPPLNRSVAGIGPTGLLIELPKQG